MIKLRCWLMRLLGTGFCALVIAGWAVAQDAAPAPATNEPAQPAAGTATPPADPAQTPATTAPPADPAAPATEPAAPAGEGKAKADEGAAVEPLPGPPEVPSPALGPTLKTVPVRKGEIGPNVKLVDATVLPRDPQGIWILEFAFKPVRLRTVELPGKGRRRIHYLYYRVVNNSGKPRMFVPQFTLVTDTGKRYEDSVIPQAVELIQAREDPSIPLLGAVDVVGYLPPSGTKAGVDDAVYGVAMWENVDPEADHFSIYIRGLSDGYRQVSTPDGKARTQYKTLRIDFLRPGDERNLKEEEIHLAEPPYDWIYW